SVSPAVRCGNPTRGPRSRKHLDGYQSLQRGGNTGDQDRPARASDRCEKRGDRDRRDGEGSADLRAHGAGYLHSRQVAGAVTLGSGRRALIPGRLGRGRRAAARPSASTSASPSISKGGRAVAARPAVHRTLPLSLTFDHRVVTGGGAARFLAALKSALETA